MKFDKAALAKQLTREILFQSNKTEQPITNLSIESAIARGQVFGPLSVEASADGKPEFCAKSFYSRFRKGDRVILLGSVGGSIVPLEKNLVVNSVSTKKVGEMRLQLSGRKMSLGSGPFFLSQDYNPIMDWKLRKAILNINQDFTSRQLKLCGNALSMISTKLNSTQLDAIERLLNQNMNGAIQGPPGTGKTQTLIAIVEIAIASGLKVGIAAFTHTAVDNALSRVASDVKNSNCIRVGDSKKVDLSKYPEDTYVAANFGQVISFNVIGATVHSWVLSKPPRVDLLILDEAGQIPAFMAPVLASKANSIVCLGDHKQLPPVLQAARPGETVDLFSLFLEQTQYPTMLEEQFRMNSTIQEWSSLRYYEGKLRPNNQVANRDILSIAPGYKDRSIVDLLRFKNSEHLVQQAAHVLDEVKLASSADLPFSQIGIICPHRDQASAINQQLQQEYGPNIMDTMAADTVERFQGQEKELVILCLSTRTSTPTTEQAAFIANPRRLNVALTRAKSRVTCVSNTQSSDLLDTELKDFLEWCSNKSLKKVA